MKDFNINLIPLTRQQRYVYATTYVALAHHMRGCHRSLKVVLGKVHECPCCTCRLFSSEQEKEIDECLTEALEVNEFSNVFFDLDNTWRVLGMFGVVKQNAWRNIFNGYQVVLLCQWPTKLESVPTYQERLANVRKNSMSRLIGWVNGT